MLIEIYECDECSRRIVKVGGKWVKADNCGGSLKLMADTEVSMLRFRELLRDLMERPLEPEARCDN